MFDPDDNTCESCGGRPDICFRPMRFDDGTTEPGAILCRACIHPDELEDFAFIRQTCIYQPERMEFSCEETDWRYITPDTYMPAQLQHIPTSIIFQLDMDIPEGAETFQPLRCINAIVVHHCKGRFIPGGDELVRIASEAMTLWLMDAGYLNITSHTDKIA